MFATKLRHAQGSADLVFHSFGEGQQVIQGGPNPK